MSRVVRDSQPAAHPASPRRVAAYGQNRPVFAGVVALQRRVGNRAVGQLMQRAPVAPARSVEDIERELEAVRQEARDVRGVGNDLVEQELGHRPASPGKTGSGLKGVEKRGGTHAESAKRLRKELEAGSRSGGPPTS